MHDDTPPPALFDAILLAILRKIDARDGCKGRIPIASVRAMMAKLSPGAFRVWLLDSERRGAIGLCAAEGDDVQPVDAIVVPGRGVLASVEIAPKLRPS